MINPRDNAVKLVFSCLSEFPKNDHQTLLVFNSGCPSLDNNSDYSMSSKWITQNRINQEMKSIAKERPPHLFAAPLPDNMFVWHFTITGPENTDFHEGLYHGEIVLPKEYPFKPPEVLFMNENGRFEPYTKICLSITQYHPETWSAGISIRMMLEAIVAIFDDKVPGIGSVEAPPYVRRKLARQSHSYSCEKCGLVNAILKPREAIHPTETEPTNSKEPTETQKDIKFEQFIKQLPARQKQEQKRKEKQEQIEPRNEDNGEKKEEPVSKWGRFKKWWNK